MSADEQTERLCEQCFESVATNDEWGAWLCDDCTTATDLGDNGAQPEDIPH